MSEWVSEWVKRKEGREGVKEGRKEERKEGNKERLMTQGRVSITKNLDSVVLKGQWGHTLCQCLYKNHMVPDYTFQWEGAGGGRSPGENKFGPFLRRTGSSSTVTPFPVVTPGLRVRRWNNARGAGRHPKISSLPLLARESLKPIWRCPWGVRGGGRPVARLIPP